MTIGIVTLLGGALAAFVAGRYTATPQTSNWHLGAAIAAGALAGYLVGRVMGK